MRNNIERKEEDKGNQEKHAYNEDNYRIVRNMQLNFPSSNRLIDWFKWSIYNVSVCSFYMQAKGKDKEKAPL